MKISRKYDCYFFDFFGTVMHRKCSGDDIKRIWSNRMALFLNQAISSKQLYMLRIAAEQCVCKKDNDYEFQYQEMVEEIYRRITNISEYREASMDNDAFVNLSLQTEVSIEIEMQEINQSIVTLIDELKRDNKHVYILSDFYLGEKVIGHFLKAKGLEGLAEKIFVSCDLGKNKASGAVYELITEALGIDTTACCMIGDNYLSDCVNAGKHGFGYYKVRGERNLNKHINAEKMILKCTAGESKAGMSYANYSFLFFKFISSLYAELRKDGQNHVYFLSREGELLKNLFDLYCVQIHEKYGLPIIQSHYLYVSRQSTYSASLKSIEEEAFQPLFSQYPDLTIDAFLLNIGFSDEDICAIHNIFNGACDKIISDFSDSEEFAKLKRLDVFRELYVKTVSKSKEVFTEYLRQNNFFDTNTVSIVDVGWKGSIQDYISRCIGETVTLKGYYCGLQNNANCSASNLKKGLIFAEYPYKSDYYEVWSYDARFMERLLTASHASTRGYEANGETIIPCFNEFGSEKNNYNLIRPIQDVLIKRFSTFVNQIYSLPILSDELEKVLLKIHLNSCCFVHRSDMVLQTQLLAGQTENFGFQIMSGTRLREAFSTRNIIGKLKNNLRLIRKTSLIVNVLNSKGLYWASCVLTRVVGRKMRREYL